MFGSLEPQGWAKTCRESTAVFLISCPHVCRTCGLIDPFAAPCWTRECSPMAPVQLPKYSCLSISAQIVLQTMPEWRSGYLYPGAGLPAKQILQCPYCRKVECEAFLPSKWCTE